MDKINGNSISWGQSMYGGWYITYYTNTWMGEHFDKIYELRAWAKEHGITLNPHQRYDTY